MKKINILIIILIFLTITTVYASSQSVKINGLSFEIPEEFTNGYSGSDYYNAYNANNYLTINVYSNYASPEYFISEIHKDANTREIKYIDERPVIYLTSSNKHTDAYIIFESNKKLVSIEVDNTQKIPDSVVEMVRKLPASTITSAQLNNITLNSYSYYNPDETFNLNSEKTSSINGVSIDIPYYYQFGTISKNIYGEDYKKVINKEEFHINVYSNIHSLDSSISYALKYQDDYQEYDINNHHVFYVRT